MKLTDLVDKLGLAVRSAGGGLDREVTGGYVSDLLSDVMGHSNEGDLWITLQRHQNVVAVASLKGLVGVVLVGGREPEEEALQKAETEDIPILVTELPAFELVGRLYLLGIRGAVRERAEVR